MEKKFHTHDTHWLIMLDFMEQKLEFARGNFSGLEGKRKNRELWDELTNLLNAAGLGVRTREKWQKAWTDLKSKVRQKAATIKFQQQATGGGEETVKPRTDIELRVIAVFGTTSFQGTDNPERGLSHTRTYVGTSTEENDTATICTPSNEPVPVLGEMNTQKRKHVEDTSSTPKKIKKEQTLSEAVCVETIGLLQDIKDELHTFNLNFKEFLNIFQEMNKKDPTYQEILIDLVVVKGLCIS